VSRHDAQPGKRLLWTLVGGVSLTFALAMTCNLVLDFLQVGGNASYIWRHSLGEQLVLSVFNSAVIWLVILLVLSLTGRLWLTSGLALSAALLVGFVNYQKLQLRQEPLYPNDWGMAEHAGFLTQMVGGRTVAFLVTLIGLVLLVAVLTGRLMGTRFPRVTRKAYPKARAAPLAIRLTGVVVSVAALAYVSTFNAPGNQLRTAYESHGAHWAFWFQKLNYQKNGFVAGTLYNMNVPAMARPSVYGRAEMQRITRTYSAVAADINRDRTGELDDVNLVFVLSEAFSDPTRLTGIAVAEDPIPYTRSLMQRTTSGQMLAHLYGGGTANMEFEALTGMSLSQFAPQMNTPYQMLVAEYDHFPSAVGYLKERGHAAVAIHPYMTAMYKREKVYPTLGFDEFVHDETMASTERLEDSEFISDAAAFAEVERQIRAAARPLLVNLVTMQNHWPMKDSYADPIAVEGLSDPEAEEQAEHYARGLRYTDDALASFISSVEESDEKTIVVFYGDHLPAVWPKAVRKENGHRVTRETPFFVYANFGNVADPRPTTSPIFFMNHVLRLADAPVPAYYALLGELESEVSAMERGMLIAADDRQVEKSQLTSRAKQLLHDYRLVQYDLAVGARYAQEPMFYSRHESAAASGAG
jgi:phosphoglycerol transferase MdoB-like AlkP superfamily enzyme